MNMKFNACFLLIISIQLYASDKDNFIKPSDIAIVNTWDTGYEVHINVSQLQMPWTIIFDLNSANQRITSIWGVANPDQVNKASSHVQVSNAQWATQEIGFIASKTPRDAPGIKNIVVNSESNKKKSIEPVKTPNPSAPPATSKRPTSISQNADTKHTADTKKNFDAANKPSSYIAQSKYHVIGYFPNWFKYNKIAPFTLDNVQGDKLTIINYAFAKPYTTTAQQRNGKTPNVINYRASLSDPWADCGGDCWGKSLPDLAGPTGCDIKNVCPIKLGGNFAQIQKLKEKYPHLQIMISIGGWEMHEEGFPERQFSILASKPETRKEFIDSCLELCARFGFDGVDIDWEYPGFSPSGTKFTSDELKVETNNFTLLLRELHAAVKDKKLLKQVYDETYIELKKIYDKLETYEQNNTPVPLHRSPPAQGLMLTIAGPAGLEKMKNMNLSEIHNYVDFINVMAYDFGGAWGPLSYHLAPLYPSKDSDATLCADFAVNYYIKQGVPKEKIVMGVPLYARSAKVEGKDADEKNGLLVKVSGAGPGTTQAGSIDYSDLTRNYLNAAQNEGKQGYVYHWDEKALVPWLYNPEAKVFIGFDNLLATEYKAQYIKQKKLRGAMIWQLENNANIWKAVKLIKDILQ